MREKRAARVWLWSGLMVLAAASAVVSPLASCYNPNIPDCTVRCGPGAACPGAMSCSDGYCRHAPGLCLVAPAIDGASDRGDASDAGDAGDRDGDATDRPNVSPEAGVPNSDAGPDTGPGRCGRRMYFNVVRQICLPAHDLNGDGKADLITDEQTEIDALVSTGHSFTFAKWFDGMFIGAGGVYAADVTGDGYADGVALSPDGSGYVAVVSTGGPGFGTLNTTFYSVWAQSGPVGTKGTFLADVSGDGKADEVAAFSNGIQVALSTGTKFAPMTTWVSADLSGYGSIFLADVTGDGIADAVLVGADSIGVAASTGSSFDPPRSWRNYGLSGGLGTFFADANGDGQADGIRLDGAGIWVSLARKGSFADESQWYMGEFDGTGGTYVADADGDGMADVIAVDNSAVRVARSTGTTFAPPVVWYTGQFGTYYGIETSPDPGNARTSAQ